MLSIDVPLAALGSLRPPRPPLRFNGGKEKRLPPSRQWVTIGAVNSDQQREQLVVPFYMEMMRENARSYGANLLPALVEAGRTTTPQDIVALLGDQWRTKVMGAWF